MSPLEEVKTISKARYIELFIFSATMAAAIGANAALFFTPPKQCEKPKITPEEHVCNEAGYGAPRAPLVYKRHSHLINENQVILPCGDKV